jgi:predicted amidophosphoribosyltransferase
MKESDSETFQFCRRNVNSYELGSYSEKIGGPKWDEYFSFGDYHGKLSKWLDVLHYHTEQLKLTEIVIEIENIL